MNGTTKALFGTVMLWPVAVAWAEPATVDVFLNSRYSDNINLQDGNEQDDVEHSLGIGIDKTSRPDACRGSLIGEVAFVTYQNSTNNNEITGTADADGVCEPNRNFRWNARDSLRQVRTAARAPNTPDNREQRNIFATGPTFTLYPSARDSLSLDAEFQMSRFEESSDDDSNRVTTSATWQRLVSSTLEGGVAASHSDIDYRGNDEKLNRDNANLFFTWRRPNGEWSGEAGYTWLETEQGILRDESQGFTGLLRYSHQWEAGLGGFGEVRRTLTDVSTDLDIQVPGVDLNLAETAAVTVTAYTTGLTQRWTERTDSDLTVSFTETDYEVSDAEEERFNADLGLNHRFGTNLSGRVSSRYLREDFGDDVIDTVGGELGIEYQRTRDLNLSASLGHEIRNAEQGTGETEYRENWIQVGVRYNLR